jgi:hypothetical protein
MDRRGFGARWGPPNAGLTLRGLGDAELILPSQEHCPVNQHFYHAVSRYRSGLKHLLQVLFAPLLPVFQLGRCLEFLPLKLGRGEFGRRLEDL